jgi:hypothetical protein
MDNHLFLGFILQCRKALLKYPLIVYTDLDTSLCKAREETSTCPMVRSRRWPDGRIRSRPDHPSPSRVKCTRSTMACPMHRPCASPC